MYETLGIEIGGKNNLFSYMGDTTSKYKNMYNVANFYIRQVMFGVNLKPEERSKIKNEI